MHNSFDQSSPEQEDEDAQNRITNQNNRNKSERTRLNSEGILCTSIATQTDLPSFTRRSRSRVNSGDVQVTTMTVKEEATYVAKQETGAGIPVEHPKKTQVKQSEKNVRKETTTINEKQTVKGGKNKRKRKKKSKQIGIAKNIKATEGM